MGVKPEDTHRSKRGRGLKLAALTSLASKGGNILLQIVGIAMARGALGEMAYGCFAMIGTVIAMVILAEIGVGPGLTNVLAKAIAKEDGKAASGAFSR